MIYFTLMSSQKTIAINPDHVVSVTEWYGGGSQIHMVDGQYENVTESMLTVVGELIAARKG